MRYERYGIVRTVAGFGLTRKSSQVQILYRPPRIATRELRLSGFFLYEPLAVLVSECPTAQPSSLGPRVCKLSAAGRAGSASEPSAPAYAIRRVLAPIHAATAAPRDAARASRTTPSPIRLQPRFRGLQARTTHLAPGLPGPQQPPQLPRFPTLRGRSA